MKPPRHHFPKSRKSGWRPPLPPRFSSRSANPLRSSSGWSTFPLQRPAWPRLQTGNVHPKSSPGSASAPLHRRPGSSILYPGCCPPSPSVSPPPAVPHSRCGRCPPARSGCSPPRPGPRPRPGPPNTSRALSPPPRIPTPSPLPRTPYHLGCGTVAWATAKGDTSIVFDPSFPADKAHALLSCHWRLDPEYRIDSPW